jgi:hypothetical protein
MTSITKTIFAVLILVASFICVGNTSTVNAANSEVKFEKVEKSDWLIFSRVVEPSGLSYIYIFTEGGVFVTKYEEL